MLTMATTCHRHQRRQGGVDRQEVRTDKKYYWHTGYPGGIKERTARPDFEGRFPERVIEKGRRAHDSARPPRPRQMKNLRVYAGSNTRMKPSSRKCSTSPR
jgi:ribosomal protein L13